MAIPSFKDERNGRVNSHYSGGVDVDRIRSPVGFWMNGITVLEALYELCRTKVQNGNSEE